MNPLKLRDIHLPGEVSWWPPATGWWFVLLLLAISAVVAYFILKKRQQVSVRQTALIDIQRIKHAYQQHADKTLLSQQLSQLLRQVLLSSYERTRVASATGEEWLALLHESHPKGQFELIWLRQLSQAAYQKEADFDAEALLHHIEHWIKTYPERYLL